jgi:uncharacterized protein (DUF1499 family)
MPLKDAFSRALLIGAPLILMCCAGAPDRLGIDAAGRLKPCPSSPNCVSTRANDSRHQMAPLPYRVDRATSRHVILSVVRAMPRTTIVIQADHYLHVEFRSRLFGFVDDVEFQFDDEAAVIHFRSASRTGYSDRGVNRQRMTVIEEAYRTATPGEVEGERTPQG